MNKLFLMNSFLGMMVATAAMVPVSATSAVNRPTVKDIADTTQVLGINEVVVTGSNQATSLVTRVRLRGNAEHGESFHEPV